MDAVQDEHERAVANIFVEWYNRLHGTAYVYHTRGADPPDFVYRDGNSEMLVEVTAAYYDAKNAAILWRNARRIPGAPQSWMSKEPDRKLVESVNVALEKKCGKPYPPGCVLLVNVYPDITSAEEFQELLHDIHVPANCFFAEIYVTGEFPTSSGGSPGGYSCWKLV